MSKGLNTDSLSKKTVKELLKTAPEDIKEVLKIRQQLAKSSVKKYQAMENAACNDNRERGMFQFYGANRSGRFAGCIVQLQNLPQNHIDDLEAARQLVKDNRFTDVKEEYESVADTLSQLIRTAFIPKIGMQFIIADYAAIEARVLAWLAGEQWRLDAFNAGKDIYCASASQMFGVPVEKNGVNGELRQKGKIAELALGYGGSVGALTAMGALDMGLKESELNPLMDAWRQSNQHITDFWWAVDRTVKDVIIHKSAAECYGLNFECRKGMLFIHLPSGRCLSYCKPKIGKNQFGEDSVLYMGVGNNKKWVPIESYGPKFVENITQAIARDILCFALKTLRKYRIVAHVHDEIIIETTLDMGVEDICSQMSITLPWAEGLPLRADGYACQFYRKEPLFSDSSYGFRPGRRCEQAIVKLLEYFNDGYTWIVDIDLEKFFDKVPQDKLMSYVGRVIHDGDTESLIRKYLKAGVMNNGIYEATNVGTPQGGNLSPLLSNIMLNELDKELESRGQHFTRYADDVVIVLKSKASATRVMYSITKWIERKLGLKVNATKTKITTPSKLKYLGFGFVKIKEEWKSRPYESSVERLKRKLKQLCKRSWSVDLTYRIKKINEVIRGWINYFRIAMMKSKIQSIDAHLRRMMRVIIWKQWKTRRKRAWGLTKLGIHPWQAKLTAGIGDRYMVVSNHPAVKKAISKEKLTKRGLISLSDYYQKVHI